MNLTIIQRGKRKGEFAYEQYPYPENFIRELFQNDYDTYFPEGIMCEKEMYEQRVEDMLDFNLMKGRLDVEKRKRIIHARFRDVIPAQEIADSEGLKIRSLYQYIQRTISWMDCDEYRGFILRGKKDQLAYLHQQKVNRYLAAEAKKRGMVKNSLYERFNGKRSVAEGLSMVTFGNALADYINTNKDLDKFAEQCGIHRTTLRDNMDKLLERFEKELAEGKIEFYNREEEKAAEENKNQKP